MEQPIESNIVNRLKHHRQNSGSKLPEGEHSAKVIGTEFKNSKAGNPQYTFKVRFSDSENDKVNKKERTVQFTDDPAWPFMMDNFYDLLYRLGLDMAAYNGLDTKEKQHAQNLKYLDVIEEANPRFLVKVTPQKNPQYQNFNIVMKSVTAIEGLVVDEELIKGDIEEASAPAAPAVSEPSSTPSTPAAPTGTPAAPVATKYFLLNKEGQPFEVSGEDEVKTYVLNGYSGQIWSEATDWTDLNSLGFSPNVTDESEAPVGPAAPSSAVPAAPTSTTAKAGTGTKAKPGIKPLFGGV